MYEVRLDKYSGPLEKLLELIETKKLEEGDWLYRYLKLGKKIIKKSWHGLNSEEIKKNSEKIQKNKNKAGNSFCACFFD